MIIDTIEDLKTEVMTEIGNTIHEEEILEKERTIDLFREPGQNINNLKIKKYVILLFSNVSLLHINKSKLKSISILYIKKLSTVHSLHFSLYESYTHSATLWPLA